MQHWLAGLVRVGPPTAPATDVRNPHWFVCPLCLRAESQKGKKTRARSLLPLPFHICLSSPGEPLLTVVSIPPVFFSIESHADR